MKYCSHTTAGRITFHKTIIVLSCIALGSLFTSAWAVNLPTLPQTFDTTYSAPAGNTITVAAGGNLQTALNNAQLGDTIVLQAGAAFTGPITLPSKSGTGWIYVRSSKYSNLPAPGTRVSPSDAANMAAIVADSNGGTTIQTSNGAHNFRFIGIEFRPTSGTFLYNLITLGNNDTSTATLPDYIWFDRCYIHGDSTVGTRRGIAGNAAHVAVVDSYLSDFKEVNADTQAFWAVNTPGPIKLVNNYLEAAGENIMFGGSQPQIAAFIPADIEIRDNLISKPLSWLTSTWSVKNLLEFKLGIRALVAHNRFENNWAESQTGFSLLVTPRNEFNSFPQAVTKDITVTGNLFVNAGQGMAIAGIDDGDGVAGRTSQRTERVLIRDNVIQVTMLAKSGKADGRIFMVTGGPIDLTIDHNTAFTPNSGNSSAQVTDNLYGRSTTTSIPADRFSFTNNLISNGTYSWWGTNTGTAVSTMATHYTNSVLTKNAFIDIAYGNYNASQFPAGNLFPVSIAAVGFTNYGAGNFLLSNTSPYHNAGTDGKDLGANIGIVATAGVVAIRPNAPAATNVN
jgi:hypothetical protein